MRTNEISREQISALADGELGDEHIDMAFAKLRHDEVRADWELYHQIGDVLRSDDMAVTLSPGFAARMAARLDAEPAILAPAGQAAGQAVREERRSLRRWAAPSIAAAAAMATIAFVTTPQLMVALKEAPRIEGASTSIATASPAIESGAASIVTPASDTVILRDPRIDDYLLAHQRFSPSVYSTAQYARSATFLSDSGK